MAQIAGSSYVSAYALLKCFSKMTCPIRRGELVHLITVIDPTFTSSTSTFQVEVGVLYLFSLVCGPTRTTDSRLRRWSWQPMVRTVQCAEMVSPHRRELLIPDLSISYLSGCQKNAPCCLRQIDRLNFTRGFLTASSTSSAQNYVVMRYCLAAR